MRGLSWLVLRNALEPPQTTAYPIDVTTPLTVTDFDYALPPELIAQTPASTRTASRLLHVDETGQLHDRQFPDLLSLLRPNDLLVFNDTRVIKARLFGQKTTGGKVEVLIERVTGLDTALAHIRSSKSPTAGGVLRLAESFNARVLGRDNDLFILEFERPVLDLLEQFGATPLPPYITHQPDDADDDRYQTIYAREPGAVAAPTAGLHFDQALFEQLDAAGIKRAFVTLHVGAGTFQPVRVNTLAEHIMHAERYTVPPETLEAIARARSLGGRVIAVGTTSVRSLESAATDNPHLAARYLARTLFAQRAALPANVSKKSASTSGQSTALNSNAPQAPAEQKVAVTAQTGDTRLFITPGFDYQVIDAMITNFHLPQSTLLMLVAAFIGLDQMHHAYQHAIDKRYRFFSYGDAMFLERNPKL
jgi:S-adenosylmethionine:tRNA ribosyltransferase-isomerase